MRTVGGPLKRAMRDVFRGQAQLPPEDLKTALEEYIQPETWGAKALFTCGLLSLKIKKYVPPSLLFSFYYFFINPILRVARLCWRVLFGSPQEILQNSRMLRILLSGVSASKGLPATRTNFSSFLARVAKPASFWGLFFLMAGRSALGFKIFRLRNKGVEPTSQQLYSEALCAYLAEEFATGFTAASRALRQAPDHSCAAVILARCALKANREYDAIDILTKSSHSSFNVSLAAILLVNIQELDEAVSILMHHITQFPEDADAAGDYLLALNRRTQCLKAYDIAFAYNSDRMVLFKRALALPATFSTGNELTQVFTEIIDDLDHLKTNSSDTELIRYYDTSSRIWRWGEVTDPLANLHYLGEKDLAMTKARAECYLANFPELHFQAPHITKWKEQSSRRIKLGFFLEGFNPHMESGWSPIFERLDREDFHLILFAPEEKKEGAALARLPRLANCFEQIIEYPFPFTNFFNTDCREYGPKALPMLRDVVASAELDILYSPVAGQDQISQFLMYARLAPVQIVDGARQTSRGMPEIDYFLMHNGDFVGDPNEYFSEKLAVLGGYAEHLLHSLKNQQIATTLQRKDWTLPEKTTIYCCIQEITRRHPDMDPILAALLNRDPESLLVVTDYGLPGCYEAFIEQMKKHGVSEPKERIRVAPSLHAYGKEYFAGYVKLMDANLSYRRMSGGASFYDLLSFRIPQIIWPHESFAGCTGRIYERMGMDDLLANSADDYVEKAYRLAHDRRWKAKMTSVLSEKINGFVKRANRENGMTDLRQFYKDAVARARSGLPPAHWHGGRFYDQLTAAHLQGFIRPETFTKPDSVQEI